MSPSKAIQSTKDLTVHSYISVIIFFFEEVPCCDLLCVWVGKMHLNPTPAQLCGAAVYFSKILNEIWFGCRFSCLLVSHHFLCIFLQKVSQCLDCLPYISRYACTRGCVLIRVIGVDSAVVVVACGYRFNTLFPFFLCCFAVVHVVFLQRLR